MLARLSSTVSSLSLSLILFAFVVIISTETNSASGTTSNFSENLKSKIDGLISNALNETGNVLNSSLITNESNLTSSNIIISSNKVFSAVNSNDSDSGSSSLVKNEINTSNGECTSIKVGGNGNDTLTSSGNCSDDLTGGPGADKFTCGEGNDTIKDFNPKDRDVISDEQNCETIL